MAGNKDKLVTYGEYATCTYITWISGHLFALTTAFICLLVYLWPSYKLVNNSSKLKKIAKRLLVTAKKISTKAPSQDRVVVTSIEPKPGPAGSKGDGVKIIGKGFGDRIIVHSVEDEVEIRERTNPPVSG
jgi:hypothetical protein